MKEKENEIKLIEWEYGKKNKGDNKPYSKHLNGTLKKIDKVFMRAYKHRLAVDDGKNEREVADAYTTLQGYRNAMQQLAVEYYETFGTSDITKFEEEKFVQLFHKRIDDFYENGATGNVSTVKRMVSAVTAFQEFSDETKVFQKKVEFCNTKEFRSELEEMKFERAQILSGTKKSNLDEVEKIAKSIEESGNERGKSNREFSANFVRAAGFSGGRGTNLLKLKATDIAPDGRTVTFRSDKGDKTRIAHIHTKKGRELFKKLKENAESKNRERVFVATKTNGEIKSVKSTREMISKHTKKASDRTGITTTVNVVLEKGERPRLATTLDIDKNQHEKVEVFRLHSARKGFAYDIAHYYLKEVKNGKFEQHFERQIRNEQAIAEEKARKGGQDVQKARNEARERYINKFTRENGVANGFKKGIWRSLNDAEKSLFLSSNDLGHSRVSIMSCYIDRKAFVNYSKTLK